MSKSYYRVFFSSNSQRQYYGSIIIMNVKELLSCFLFKQFTTHTAIIINNNKMSKSYYRVFFSSNSQLFDMAGNIVSKCQRATIVFSFQAIHNKTTRHISKCPNVKELLSCFLFKQFTTEFAKWNRINEMSKSYYRVFFSSNSQLS